MKQLLKHANKIYLFVFAIAFLGCEDANNIFPTVTSNFTYTVNEGTVTFINISEDARTYAWNFGDGSSSTENNPIKTYAESGTYTVTLTASNDAGASDASQSEVPVTITEAPPTGGGGDPEVATSLPIDFESNETLSGVFEEGDGVTGAPIANPDQSGINTSDTVYEFNKATGAAWYSGLFQIFPSDIDLSATQSFTFKIWSPKAGINVRLQLEKEGGGPVTYQIDQTLATADEWVSLTFDFTGIVNPADGYDKIVIFPDFDDVGQTAGDGSIYYIDDIEQGGATGGGNSLEDCGGDLVDDFETADDTIFSNFGGGVGTIIDNPDTSVNTSAKVAQYVKGAGEVFAGITIEVDPDIDFNAGVFSMDVSSQAVRQLLFKLEGLGIEVIIPTSGTGWETLTYDFSAVAGNIGAVTAITLIMDNGTAGDGSADWTVQFDNIRLCSNQTSGGGNSLEDCGGDLVDDFETADDTIFSNFGGGVGTIIDNPDTSVNTSAKVAQYVKGAGEVFAGITIEVDPDIDFNAGVFSMDVSSQAVRQLLFKLEGLNIEVIIPTSGTGWETLTYDFSAVAGNIGAVTAITLIMDNGTAGDGSADWTIQFDNIRLCSNQTSGGGNSLEDCGGDLVDDFETADDTIFSNFGGGVGTIIDNPDTSVNTSAKVAQYVKGAGEVFAGITIEVDPDIDFNAGVFSMDVSSQAVRQLLFKLEGLGIEVIIPTSGTGWETLTYDFSAVAGNIGAVTAITLIMDNGTAGDGSADWTVQFDNIRLCSNQTSGGGNSLEDCGGDLVDDFETADDTIFSNFGGGVGTIIDNPDTSVNTSAKVAQYVKGAGEVFAGITIEVDPDIDFNAGVFSMDVYSQAVRQLLFKLEGLNIEVIVPTSGTGWETLTYDFSAVAGNIGTVTAITLIMDNGTAGDGSADWTIQFDNIRLCSNQTSGGGGTGGELAANGDFETGDDTGWLLFQNGGTSALDNTISNGGTWSGKLETGGPSNPAFKQERIGAGSVNAGDTVQVQFDHIGSVVQPGAVFNVILFGEGAAGASFTNVFNPPPSLSGSWTTFTGTFTIPGGTDVSEGISFLIEAVCGGDAGCSVSANIDNVSVTVL